MHPYYQPLAESYQQHANAENAYWMKKYMKDQFDFFGIKSPERKLLNRSFFSQQALPQYSELENIIDSLLVQPERELHYFAITLSVKMKNYWNEETWKLFEKMILSNSWWDTVDVIAISNCGLFFKKYPDLKMPVTQAWNSNGNQWLVRSSILFQLQYKKDTDEELLFGYIRPHIGNKDFFTKKAIGWALRQYSKTNPLAVLQFVKENDLQTLSRREALKHLDG